MKKKQRKPSPAELAGDVFCAVKLTPAERKEADRQLAEARKKTQQEMTEQDRMELKMFQLRFNLEDYLSTNEYNPKMSFGYFLKRYVDILNTRQKLFAEEISIDETLLSQLINGHRMPPDYITIRLEIHSHKIIPAHLWYKLVEQEKEYFIKNDVAIRKKEAKYVHVSLPVSARTKLAT